MITEDSIDLASEKVIIQVPIDLEVSAHTGGSLAWDKNKNLFISTGDNTVPFESNGYSPLDERKGRIIFDAQRSAGNTNDLRGKVLRIHPETDGSYTVPDGNMFAKGTADTRPEIYTMGCRNPYRISVNQATSTVYWGEVGPDAGDDSKNDPRGYDEFNQAKKPGNYGWPYFVANNLPYRDYDFASTLSGNFFDPAAPVNNSPNNTGITNLPPARPAWIWTIRSGTTPQFPELLAGNGRCAMGGPVYHFDPQSSSPKRLPAYYDNTVFIYDWSRNYIWEVKLDADGDILKINRFLSTFSFIRPHEMELGPDGMLYMIEWGSNFNGDNADAKVVRIEYLGGNPVPGALSIQSSGSNVVIAFPDNAGTLEWANDVKGSWHAVLPPLLSPYIVSRDTAMKFYRLRWP